MTNHHTEINCFESCDLVNMDPWADIAVLKSVQYFVVILPFTLLEELLFRELMSKDYIRQLANADIQEEIERWAEELTRNPHESEENYKRFCPYSLFILCLCAVSPFIIRNGEEQKENSFELGIKA